MVGFIAKGQKNINENAFVNGERKTQRNGRRKRLVTGLK